LKRVAFFGGSFDPPHFGHLAVAREAMGALGLDRVLFAPVGRQPLKEGGASAGFEDRVAMTRLAIAGEVRFEVSLIDQPIEGGRPNYTVETLTELSQVIRGKLYLLVGADSFLNLRDWYRGEEIPFFATLVVVSRPGEELGEVGAMLPEGVHVKAGPVVESSVIRYELGNELGESAQLYVLPDLHYDVSATQLREQIHGEGVGLPGCLPNAVLRYIRERGLYL